MPTKDATLEYYEGDYPSQLLSRFPENFDATTERQGIRYDVECYCEIAGSQRKRILELCCGSGRVGIPLAKLGHEITGVDICPQMLTRYAEHLDEHGLHSKVTLIESDIVELDLDERNFDLCLIPFNSLLLVGDFLRQRKAISRAAEHLRPSGEFVADVVNPLLIPPDGETTPKPFFTRRHPVSGNLYTRFAARSAFDAAQRQTLFGWYDEIRDNGSVHRQHYEMLWRPIFRFELELMLTEAGLSLSGVNGGHRNEPFSSTSGWIFSRATKH